MIGLIEMLVGMTLVMLGASFNLLAGLVIGCIGAIVYLSYKTPSPSKRRGRDKKLKLLMEQHGLSYTPKEADDEDPEAGR